MIGFLIAGLILCGAGIFFLVKAKSIKVIKTHQQKEQQTLQQKIKQLQIKYNEEEKGLNNLRIIIKQRQQEINSDYSNQVEIVKDKLEDFKKVTRQAASHYFDTLQKDYEDAEAAHKRALAGLETEYNAAAADLEKIKKTRQAAYDAILKQNEIKQNKDNYRLIPSTLDLQDIHSLERIKQSLHKPRILSMLIWQTYWQPIAKKQFPIIIQAKTKIGIYKITNIQTDQSYIGQSLDIYKRWCQHCKAGLGIDTPAGNKLYKAIQEYGLESFTFEILCECEKEELNQKEKYFIELYQADLFGYNGNIGIKK